MEEELVILPVAIEDCGSVAHKNFTHEYERVRFSSDGETYRAKLSSTKGKTTLWFEGRKTKLQFQCVIDPAHCGPSGIPGDIIKTLMHRGLQLVDMCNTVEGAKAASDDPVVLKSDEAVTLVLSLCGGEWKPRYVFPLVPIAVNAVAKLEARVRDLDEAVEAVPEVFAAVAAAEAAVRELQEGIKAVPIAAEALANLEAKVTGVEKGVQSLNEANERKPVCIGLYSDVAAAANAKIDWRSAHMLKILHSDFDLSEDGTTVTVKVGGLYQLHVDVSVRSNASNTKTLDVLLNDASVAEAYQNDSTGELFRTASIHRILPLANGDKLCVLHTGNIATGTVAGANHFSLLRIDR